MEITKVSSIVEACLFLVFFLHGCESAPPIQAALHFYGQPLPPNFPPVGSQVDLPNLPGETVIRAEVTNLGQAQHSQLVASIRAARSFCADGFWRFYPLVNFAVTSSDVGAQLGTGMTRTCKTIDATSAARLAAYLSIRHIGPINWESVAWTMSVYPGEYQSGQAITESISTLPMANPTPITFPAKSFVITGPLNRADQDSELWCSPWLMEVGSDPKITICYNVCKCESGVDRAAMYYQSSHLEHVFHSMKLVQRMAPPGNAGVGCNEAGADVVHRVCG